MLHVYFSMRDTNFWHRNIFQRIWNICEICVKYIFVNIFRVYKENIFPIFSRIFYIYSVPYGYYDACACNSKLGRLAQNNLIHI